MNEEIKKYYIICNNLVETEIIKNFFVSLNFPIYLRDIRQDFLNLYVCDCHNQITFCNSDSMYKKISISFIDFCKKYKIKTLYKPYVSKWKNVWE